MQSGLAYQQNTIQLQSIVYSPGPGVHSQAVYQSIAKEYHLYNSLTGQLA